MQRFDASVYFIKNFKDDTKPSGTLTINQDVLRSIQKITFVGKINIYECS